MFILTMDTVLLGTVGFTWGQSRVARAFLRGKEETQRADAVDDRWAKRLDSTHAGLLVTAH